MARALLSSRSKVFQSSLPALAAGIDACQSIDARTLLGRGRRHAAMW
jgi:hypothetical protein